MQNNAKNAYTTERLGSLYSHTPLIPTLNQKLFSENGSSLGITFCRWTFLFSRSKASNANYCRLV